MKKNFERPEVEDIAMAIVNEAQEQNGDDWYVYLLNLTDVEIQNVLISSKGYGEINGSKIKTSVLRHFLKDIEPNTAKKVEMIKEDVFGLNNEYLLSFYIDGKIYDKKYIFLAETIAKQNFTTIPLLETKGILIV